MVYFDTKRIRLTTIQILSALLLPVCIFYLMEGYTHLAWQEVRVQAQIFNILIFELIGGILYFVTGRLHPAYRLEAAFAMLFGLTNAYVVRFRTDPVVPWDFFSVRTALSVAGNYDFTPDRRIVIVTVLFLALIILVGFVPCDDNKTTDVDSKKAIAKRYAVRHLIPAAVLFAALALFVNVLQGEAFQNKHRLYNKLFTPGVMVKYNGLAVTFAMDMAYVSIDKPEGYDGTEAEELLASYGSSAFDGENVDAAVLPNIIVIMDESFADLTVLGDFKTDTDPLPFLHSLQEGADNTVTGYADVSVCGGNTPNSEFEFLTGNTMAFLPQGSIPYQQYINGDIPSLVWWLDSLGYTTMAAHPFNATGWERDTVYPWLGFSESLFVSDYRNADKVRKYVSDEACVEKIIDIYEDKDEGTPLFFFNVTMQNHGGYTDTYDNLDVNVHALDAESDSLDQYLSLTKLSDEALQQLVEYFARADENTVIVFFGDHQPYDSITSRILALNGMSINSLDDEETLLRYKVPYVVWANYDIDTTTFATNTDNGAEASVTGDVTDAETSLNFLAAQVLSAAGVPTYDYQNFLLGLRGEYPVVSAMNNTLSGDSLLDYKRLQYFQLFDEGGED
jgi:phosphoglycerol transferase MdoB-like AlkP superfamily enzyme